ncbi:MAG: glycosyltransferase family 2 protein [Planctomycetota bacterium]
MNSPVFVCILYFNQVQITKECLQSVLCNQVPPDQVVLIDNGSLLEHHQQIQNSSPQGIHHLRIEQNQGFTGGFNQALEEVIRLGGREALFLTNDTLLNPGSFQALLDTPQRNTCDLLAPLVRPLFNSQLIDSLGGHFSPKTGKLSHYQTIEERILKENDYVPGTALWLKTKVHQTIRGMDTNYFCYWDDVDYSFRARQEGFVLATLPSLELQHHIRKTNRSKPLYTLYYYFRNRLRFIQSHFPQIYPQHLLQIQQELLALKQKYANDSQRRLLLEKLFSEINSNAPR